MPEALDIDLYCLNCGYNLRGLSGEMIRCPECGSDNPIGDIEPPAAIISAQLRKMETAPAVCALSAIFIICLSAACIPLLFIEPAYSEDIARTLGCLVVPLAIAFFVCLACALEFRNQCMAQPGWLGALLRYQLAALELTTPIVLLPVAVGFLSNSAAGRRALWQYGYIVVIVLIIGVILLIPLARRMHRRLRQILDPLQRTVAVRIARDELRARMMHRRGRPFGK